MSNRKVITRTRKVSVVDSRGFQIGILVITIIGSAVIGSCGNKFLNQMDKQTITQEQAKELLSNSPVVKQQEEIQKSVDKLDDHLTSVDKNLQDLKNNYSTLNQKVEDDSKRIQEDIKELKDEVKDGNGKHN